MMNDDDDDVPLISNTGSTCKNLLLFMNTYVN